jgi:hypothetical protein
MTTNTHQVGDRTEAIVMARLLQVYECVLIPFGNGRRYDLVADTGTEFLRIQCKTGRLREGAVRFNAASNHHHRNGTRRAYREGADLFGVYCPDNGKVYLVPVADVGNVEASLRVEDSKNNQQKGVRWATTYELPDSAPA